MKNIVALLIVSAMIFLPSCSRVETYNAEDSSVDTTANVNTDTAADTFPEETTAEVFEETATASFVGVGDNIIYFGTFRDAASQAYAGGRQYNFRPIYSNVEDIISSADIAFVNQETCCSENYEPESYPTFNSPVDLTYDVTEVGFDIVNLANNHMLDKGADGLRDSYNNWKAQNVTVIGCYEESNERYITYYEKNGIKIAFVSYTYGTNLNQDPAKYGLYAPYLKQSDIEGDIKEAKDNSDFVIVSVHWGDEGAMKPNDEQIKYAKIMAQSGADVILGHHPHVLEPIEWLDNGDGGKTLCCYSLGNFVHEQAYDYNVPGGIISFDICRSGNDTTPENVSFIPTVCHFPSDFYNNKVYLFEDYTPELASQHAVATYYSNSISYDSLKNYITTTISAEFLPDYLK